jgi:hypothetical protein
MVSGTGSRRTGRGIAAVLVAGAALGAGAPAAGAAVTEPESEVLAAAQDLQGNFPHAADVELHFVQEDGPDSGHVRVELTPQTVPLTLMQARSAAQQAFLAALGEPGLGDNLKRIEVVVRLMPAQQLSAQGFEQTFVYLHKGGHDWSVLAPE